MSEGMRLNLITLAILVVAVIGAAPYLARIHWTAPRIAGAAIIAISFTVIIVARFQLGAAFSIKAEARRLVTTGIYAKIRNPIYVFSPLVFVGVALVAGRWEFLLLAAVVTVVQVRRARNEACVLQEAFGEEYERYRRRTWF